MCLMGIGLIIMPAMSRFYHKETEKKNRVYNTCSNWLIQYGLSLGINYWICWLFDYFTC